MVAHPTLLWVGLGLLGILLVGLRSHAARRRRLAELLGGPRAANRVSSSNLYRLSRRRLVFLGSAAAGLALAAADPRAPAPPPAPPRVARNIVLALDISGSMQATDLRPTRLAQAVQVARDFIGAVPQDRVGLLLFAGAGYLLAPPTADHDALGYLLRGVTPQTASVYDPGSLLSVGISHAVEVLEDPVLPEGEQIIVLISDGETNESESRLRAATEAAVARGVAVHAVGVGTARGGGMMLPDGNFRRGGTVFGPNGAPAISRLREATLRRVTQWGGGVYARSGDPAQLSQLHRAVRADPGEGSEEPPATSLRMRLDPATWLALIGLLCLVLEGLLDVRLPVLRAVSRSAA